MGQIDSPLQNAFREASQISSGTTCSEKQNHTENRKTKGRSSFRRQTYQKTLGWRQCNPDVEIRKPSIYMYFVGGQVYAWHNLCPRLWQPEPGHVLFDTGWKGIVEKIRGKAGFESGKGWGSSTERRRQLRKHRYSEEWRTSCPKQGSREERGEWTGRWASLDDHSLW